MTNSNPESEVLKGLHPVRENGEIVRFEENTGHKIIAKLHTLAMDGVTWVPVDDELSDDS